MSAVSTRCAACIGACLIALGSTASNARDNHPQSGAQYAPDKDMGQVLDALQLLEPKPIQTLQPEEARAQPTPTDAVKTVLKAQGSSTDPTQLVPGVTTKDIQLPGPGGMLQARVYQPEGSGPFPLVVYFHGGGWVIASKEVYDAG